MPAIQSRSTPARKPGELAILSQIRARAAQTLSSGAIQLGIGDDCALISPRPGEELTVTTDLSVSGRHFRLDWHPPEAVGHRTLARGLSDLAAMGARPLACFLSLGLPRELVRSAGTRGGAWGGAWIERFFDGFFALANSFKAPLAGGDLAESPIAVADIVLIGGVPRGGALLRSGARAGDLLYVTGSLGGAVTGLAGLEELAGTAKRERVGGLRIPKRLETALAPHLYPQPRIAQGLWLARRKLATAALDISDGLSTDLAHLCEESGVAAEVNADSLPVYASATMEQALHGGEDYELLFTARPDARVPRSIAGVPVTRIGRLMRGRAGRPMVTLVTARGAEPLDARGWEHFS